MTADNSLPGNLVDAREEERRARSLGSDPRHLPEIAQSFLEPGYTPCCSCGWRGAKCLSEKQAWLALGRHLDPPAPLVDRDTGDEG